MKAVVDTNVIAYLLLGTEQFAEEAQTLVEAVSEVWAPALWEAELASVLWMATRQNVLTIQEAITRLLSAERLRVHSVPNRALWQGALMRARQSGIAVYDTLFVELAAREQVPLATFDGLVIKAFPKIAARPLKILKNHQA